MTPKLDKKCTPIAFEEGITDPDIMLFPYNKETDTGSLIPSISTGGAAENTNKKLIVEIDSKGKH